MALSFITVAVEIFNVYREQCRVCKNLKCKIRRVSVNFSRNRVSTGSSSPGCCAGGRGWRVTERGSSVHSQGLTRDEFGLVRSQEPDNLRHVLRRSDSSSKTGEAFRGMCPACSCAVLRVKKGGVEASESHVGGVANQGQLAASSNAIHADAFTGQVNCQRSCEFVH